MWHWFYGPDRNVTLVLWPGLLAIAKELCFELQEILSTIEAL
jgi:hypothetical protein